MKFSWPAVAAGITTILGVVLSPAVLGTLDPHIAGVITIVGGLWAVITKPIVHDPVTGNGPATPSK